MNEAYLKKRLKDALREAMPGAVIYRHEDKFSGGIPDLSVTWSGVTSWIEVKYEKNGRPSRPTELQRLALRALSGAGAPTFLLTYRDKLRAKDVKTQPHLEGLHVADLGIVDGDMVYCNPFFSSKAFAHAEVAAAIKRAHERSR